MCAEGDDGLVGQFGMFLEERAEDVGRLTTPDGAADEDR